MPEQKKPTPEHSNELKKVEQEITKVNPKIFEGIPANKKFELLNIFSIQKTHSGPLPPPEQLEKYSEIIPNGADRIMAMAEKQQAHRIELEKIAVNQQLTQSKRGQTFGFLIGLFAIGGGVACILMGHEWSGAFIGGGGITGLVSVFVLGKKQQRQSLQEKN